MRIALDGMGGDGAPGSIVEGAILGLKKSKKAYEVVLVGQTEVLEQELERLGGAPEGLHLHHASQVVGMADAPAAALRRLRDASIRVCFDLLKEGDVDAVVSAGNSGATMATGAVVMGRLPEVDRPALASVLPGPYGPVVLVDVGANVDCSPLVLLQFGYMGSAFAQRVLEVENPKVGLMSIGEEGGKGNQVVKRAYEEFMDSGLNFVGNVEGRDIFSDTAQVIVCDGFVGNVCLKLSESLIEMAVGVFMELLSSSALGKTASLLLKSQLKKMIARFDHANYGGAPLLGINGVAFICHGASSPKAISAALRQATEAVNGRLTHHLAEGLQQFRGTLLGEGDQG